MFQTTMLCYGRQCGYSDPTGEATKSESDSHSTDLDSEATLQVMKVLGMAGIVQMLHAINTP